MLAACDAAEANTRRWEVWDHPIQRRGGEGQRKLQTVNLISKIALGNKSRIFILAFLDSRTIENLRICKP